MELGDRDAELARVAAHLVERHEARVPVEGGVLDALGHRRAAQLLEPSGQLVVAVVQPGTQRGDRVGQLGPPLRGQRQGVVEVLGPVGQIGAVHLERGGDLADRLGRVGQLRDQPRHPAALGDQQFLDDQVLAGDDVVGDGLLVAGQPLVERGEGGLGRAVDEDAVDLAHRVVAGGAGHRPVGRQVLAGFEDLLDGDPGVRGQRVEPAQVVAGVDQTVGVVDPQPGDPGGGPLRDQHVGGLEDGRILHPHPGQRGHGEEAAVGELAVAARPVHQLVVLAGVHRVGVVARGHGPRRGREPMLVVAQLVVHDLEGGVVAEHREQDLVPAPVDVEPVGVRGVAPQTQDVPPGRVLGRLGDPDVVGDDVDHHAQPGVPGGGEHRVETGLSAAVGVDGGRVGGVVAVGRADRRLQDGGEVDRADPEVAQVVDQLGRLREREVLGDLEPVRRAGGGHLTTLSSRAGFTRAVDERWAPGGASLRA